MLIGVLFILRIHLTLPGWAIVSVVAAWVLKDVILFPFIWRSYDWGRPGISRTMEGSIGVVKEPLAPNGYVQINGELWKAKTVGFEKAIERGVPVRVVKRIGLTVQVVPHLAKGESDREH